jgi:integrase
MRKGELLTLIWKDVNFTSSEIQIRAFNTKTGSQRNVGMTSRVVKELSKLWELSPQNLDGLVFGLKGFKKSFATVTRISQLKDFRFHDLRHTAITRMIQAGFSPIEIMKISGHTQMTTFARYVNPDTNAVQRIAERLSAFNAEAMNEVSLSSELPN